jgi:hypothetical protein
MLARLRTAIAFPIVMIERLTTPRSDAVHSDAVFARVLQESVVFRAAHAAARPVARAKSDSVCVKVWNAIRPAAAMMSGTDRNRFVALFLVCTGATALGLLAVRPAGPLTWVVPAMVLAAGAIGWLIADPLARAMADRRR